MLDEIGQGRMHLLFDDDLIVIQDQHNALCALHEQIDERHQNIVEG